MSSLAEEMEGVDVYVWVVNLNMFGHKRTGCPLQPVDTLSSFSDPPSAPPHTRRQRY